MKKREAYNLVLHVCVGYSLALLVCWNSWFIVLATFIYAFLREQAQHRVGLFLANNCEKAGHFVIYKRTFFDFGWVTWHRVFEVIQWTIGAALACLLWYFIA